MIRLTVIFDEPFWIGVFDVWEKEEMRTAKIVFGSEPKDYEVNEIINKCFFNLKFSPPIKDVREEKRRKNPKRVRREIAKTLQQKTISTKSQQALSLEREQNKMHRKQRSRNQKEEEKEKAYEMKQEKKKQKKRGH
jgi:hypothetical protein